MDASTEIKPWYKSTTIMVNAGVAVLAAAESQFNMLAPYIGDRLYEATLFTLTMVNVALRVITT